MRIPHHARILVADGRKMLFFRNAGDAENPKLEVVTAQEHPSPADRDQKSDKPGVASSAGSEGRNTMAEVDFHQQEEDRFAGETADILKRGALAGEYEKLIVVAPPRTLGELRKHYHKEVERRLAGELAKDLTGHPVDEIERLIGAA